MCCNPLFLFIAVPVIAAVATAAVPQRLRALTALAGAAANVVTTALLFAGARDFSAPWAGTEFALRMDPVAGIMIAATATVAFLVASYCQKFPLDASYGRYFAPLLFLSVGLANGAFLSDNLTMLLFFWEGLMIPLFALIALAGGDAWKTAVKAFIIIGVTDLCLMFGMGLLEHTAETLTLSQMHVSLSGSAMIAFLFMAVGALAKAGGVPFHSWMPAAAEETPAPFMALLPGAIARLAGAYLLIRMTTEMFRFIPSSGLSIAIVVVAKISLVWGVFMALGQKDIRRMAAYGSIAVTGLVIALTGAALPHGAVALALVAAVAAVLTSIAFLRTAQDNGRWAAFAGSLSARMRSIPPLATIYGLAEQRENDPYAAADRMAGRFGTAAFAVDRAVNWVYDGLIPLLSVLASIVVRAVHTGSYATYILWSLAGVALMVALMVR